MNRKLSLMMDRPTVAALFAIVALVASTGSSCEDGIGFRLPEPLVRVVAFGDSTTNGPATTQYVDYLPTLTGRPESDFSNEGRGGETTTEGVMRLQQLMAADIFPNATDLIYWQGGNDLIDFIQDHDPFIALSPDDPNYPFTDDLNAQLVETESQIRAAVSMGQSAGLRVIIVTYYFIPEQIYTCAATPLDVIFPGQAVVANAYTTRLNALIRTVATDTGATLVDIALLDDTLRGDIANYENCNHLSATGNDLAAQQIANSL